MASFGCDETSYWEVIPFYSLNLLCLLIGCSVSIYCICHILFNKNSQIQKISSGIKTIYIVTTTSLVTQICFINCVIIRYYICPSTRLNKNSIYFTYIALSAGFWFLSFIFVEILFVFRFIHAFKNSILEVSSKVILTLKLLIYTQVFLLFVDTFLTVIYIGGFFRNINIPSDRLWFVSSGTIIILYIIGAVIATYQFLKHLKLLFNLMTQTSQISKNIVLQKRIYNLAWRIFLCCTFSILSSFITIFITTLMFITVKYGENGLVWTIINFDATLNVFLLMLQWQFAHNIYNKSCGICQKYCSNRCVGFDTTLMTQHQSDQRAQTSP